MAYSCQKEGGGLGRTHKTHSEELRVGDLLFLKDVDIYDNTINFLILYRNISRLRIPNLLELSTFAATKEA